MMGATGEAKIYGPDKIWLEGRQGSRYWISHPFEITGVKDVDKALSSFPLAVFQPPGRDPARTPVLIGLQGIAAPFQWNAFLVPTLLDMGMACVLFDTPLAGERSLIRDHPGDVVRQVMPLMEKRIKLGAPMVLSLMNAVARDMTTVLDVLRSRHRLRDDRVALFGVSLGCLLSSYAFTRDGIGQRLLGVVGHADLRLFARSYTPYITPLLVSLPIRTMSKALSYFFGRFPEAAVSSLGILNELRGDGKISKQANPMTYVDRVGEHRRARFLVGRDDSLVRNADVESCSLRFRNGNWYVVPGMGHGGVTSGPSFVDHVRFFLGTQLGDWRW